MNTFLNIIRNEERHLPTEKKFGIFLTVSFFLVCIYFFLIKKNFFIGTFSIFLALLFLIITIFKKNYLRPINQAWNILGLKIAKTTNPIILSFIYFVFFTPVAFTMRILKRDILRLSLRNENSYWVERKESSILPDSFNNQF